MITVPPGAGVQTLVDYPRRVGVAREIPDLVHIDEIVAGAGNRVGGEHGDDEPGNRTHQPYVPQCPEAETDGEGKEREQVAIQRAAPVAIVE